MAATDATSNVTGETGPVLGSSEKSIKRKLEEAIQSLDEAVLPSPTAVDGLPPAKKPRLGRSIYSTLAKYGIRKETTKAPPPADSMAKLSKTAPHLAAILSRTATKTRKALPVPFKSVPSAAASFGPTSAVPGADYRPSSMQSFLARLATFKLATYANKPSQIDAVAAAKCGWVNDGKDRLVCGICGSSWALAGREGLSRDGANSLMERQRVGLVENHKGGCPWKTRQCDPSIYRIPVQAPLAMAREIKSRAATLDSVLQNVEIKHPLTSAQVQSLVSTMTSVKKPFLSADFDTELVSQAASTVQSEPEPTPSETAIIAALFGWTILPPAPPAQRQRMSSISGTSSFRAPESAALSRSASVAPSTREGTPTPGGPPSISRGPIRSASTTNLSASTSAAAKPKADTTLLHCALCQRRVGLWAFLPPPPKPVQTNGRSATPEPQPAPTVQPQRRQLDVLREHRSYCPYVVKSTGLPSLPAPSPTPSVVAAEQGMEGWRAVLAVVMRYGMARRQRLRSRVPSAGQPAQASDSQENTGPSSSLGAQDDEELDHVEAMVAGVKAKGGKDLLKYVKGLLG